MTATVVYEGNLRTRATHLQSGTIIETDAPTDNNGLGQRFSPTDLVATALATCMSTVMGIAARTHGLNIDGLHCEVEKIMAQNPRRIGEIRVKLTMPATAPDDQKSRSILEHAGLTCPVFQSLHPDLKQTISFAWPGTDEG